MDLHLSLEILYIVILHDCHDSGLSWIIWHTMELECWMTQVGKLSFRLPAERRDWARPLGTQCVLFPVPASLFWFLLQIIDNGVYDAILLEITLQYHSIPLILLYPILSPWISPCPASSVWPLTPGRLDGRVRRRFRRRGRGQRRARLWQGRPRTPDHGATGEVQTRQGFTAEMRFEPPGMGMLKQHIVLI